MPIVFPPEPSDGLIFEAAPGLFYQFSASENTWIRVDGFDALGLATGAKDGLMSKDDLIKINDLLLPPPRITITAEGCNFTFNEGTIGFRSSKGDLLIENELELRNKVGDTVVVNRVPWQIHENTFGYNFTVDLDKLLEEMESRGNLNFRGTIGLQGDKGDVGEDGIDELETGPQGAAGEDGANVPFLGTLTQEPSGFEIVGESNRAVVDIRAEKISKDENFLVLTRANIGNLDACPALVKPKNFKSPFVLVIDDNPERTIFRKDIIQDDCGQSCALCSSLFFLDMDKLIDQVFDRFRELVIELKGAKETLANSWLTTMIGVFNQQRDAICCALENCESRNRNQDERRYIEQSRIQAAQSDFALTIDGVDDRETIDTDGLTKSLLPPECPQPGGDVNPGLPDCIDCELEVIIDGRLNSPTLNQAIVANLPAGDYIAEITDCCIAINSQKSLFTGRVKFGYESEDGPKEIIVPDFGNIPDEEDAKDAYIGIKFSFVHVGGEVRAWFPDPIPQDNSGFVTLCIKAASCFEFATEPTAQDFTVFPVPDTCEMPVSQLIWYERGWRIGACCGAHVSIGSAQFIVVKRSIGIDTTCGGGESLTTECISGFINSGKGHPAIAFPTIDGEEFFGKPITGTQQFTEDDGLSELILQKIQDGQAIEVKSSNGNDKDKVVENIPFILFPAFDPTDGSGNLLVGPGTGLAGEYFNGTAFNELVFTRRDPNIDFNFGAVGVDDPRLGTIDYSIRWTGEVSVPQDGDYTFFAQADDGVVVIVDGDTLIDFFVLADQHPDEMSGVKTLTAGFHPITVEYFQGPPSGARVKLLIEGPGLVKQVIPETLLRI